MAYPKLFLKSRRDQRLLDGHLWVFSNEIEHGEGAPEPGGIVDVFSFKKHFLGRGFYNPHSLISVRLLAGKNESVDGALLARRIADARRLREQLYPGETAYRLVFGESDFLPGLVIDRFGDCFVLQSYCLGMDVLLSQIVDALKSQFQVRALVKKNDSPIRQLEGLKEEVALIEGELDAPFQIEQKFGDRVLKFWVDPLQGQKTGFYFDQRENRERFAAHCRGKRVLDAFSYVGGFGVYAAAAGASEVTCLESGQNASALIEKNAAANGVQVSARREDAFEALERFRVEKRKFDIIVLDPPALAKSKKDVFGGLRKYTKLNVAAMAVLEKDGLLFTCSCSHHVGRDAFLQAVNAAVQESGRSARMLEMRGPARDHPVLPAMPETEYLKCAVLKLD